MANSKRTHVTLYGGFHNVAPITLRIAQGQNCPTVSVGQYKRLTRHMCPVNGCICGMHHGWRVEGIPFDILSEALSATLYKIMRSK